MRFTILNFDVLESTNTEAANQAKRGADEGLCAVAKQQTGGRGRHGRVWISPPNSGLYFSLVLRPKIETRLLPLLTLMTAIAVHDTLEQTYKFNCDIKWVNDIHVDGRKISGILAETCDTANGLAIIVGIGINLTKSGFPPEIADSATSIETEIGQIPDIETLLQNLTKNIEIAYNLLNGENGTAEIRAEWSRRSSYAAGKAVKAKLQHEMIYGTTDGIEENGALRVKLNSGEIRIVHAGDVEQLRAADLM